MDLSSPAIQAEIVEGYKTQTLRQLQLLYGCSHEGIRKILLKNGVQMRKKGSSPTPGGRPRLQNALPAQYREEDVVNALLKGTRSTDIAEFLKVRKTLIELIARRNGLVRMRGKWSRA